VKSSAKVMLRFGTEAGRFKVAPSFSAFILDITSGYRYLLQQVITTLRYHSGVFRTPALWSRLWPFLKHASVLSAEPPRGRDHGDAMASSSLQHHWLATRAPFFLQSTIRTRSYRLVSCHLHQLLYLPRAHTLAHYIHFWQSSALA
jgi:hypothetical protein